MTKRAALGVMSLVAGLCSVVAGITTLHAPGRAPADAGVLPAATSPASPAVPSVPPASRVPRLPPAPATMPVRLVVPALEVDAPVDPSGVSRNGELGIPADPARVGWWIGSARPGAAQGTVLLAGHVDTAADGPGVLFRLESLPMGSRVQVRTGGRAQDYRVTARRSYVKRRLPADLFRAGGTPRLVLITCGGSFHDGAYSDNVVVYAEPLR